MIKKKHIAYWVLAILIALPFFAGSYLKLTSSEMEVQGFQLFGYPLWFMYFIGVCELLGALGILFGKLVHKALPRLAALGLMGIMIGALYTHIMYTPLVMGIPALVISVLLILFLLVSRSSSGDVVTG